MHSKLRQAIGLATQPVAVLKAQRPPEGVDPRPCGCIIPLLAAAAQGQAAALTADSVGCPGGKFGLGLVPQAPEGLAGFLSTGGGGRPGLGYKEAPCLMETYLHHLPPTEPPACLVFRPLDQLQPGEEPLAVVFLVNPHQLSALATLASYDRAPLENVKLLFGAGCTQAVRYALCAQEAGEDTCYVGLTDPSARLHLDRDLLSFSLPYRRFRELEEKADGSFLTQSTWQSLLRQG